MFKIVPKADCEAPVLKHSEKVFHEALQRQGKYYHVMAEDGLEYDISYLKNNDMLPDNYRKTKAGIDVYPSYLTYDETDSAQLDLSLLQEHAAIVFQELNEYSLVLARLALQHTSAEVYFIDARAGSFLGRHEHLHLGEAVPELPVEKILQIVDEPFLTGVMEGNFHKLSSAPAFHSVFFWQSLTGAKVAETKYVEVPIAKNVGVGGILSYYVHAREIFRQKGWQTFLKEGSTRYEEKMLQKYFTLDARPREATEENTARLQDVSVLYATYLYTKFHPTIDVNILVDSFRREMDEYAEAVLGGRKVLGVLIRGTDYIVSKMSGARKMATVEEMLPTIQEWMEEDRYDLIFLATEDQDVLDQMKAEFGKKLRVIAQVRHSVRDFGKAMLLSDLEKEEQKENAGLVEDNIVNYFYALYLLSKCQSFMASGQCHGWNVVNSFRQGGFKRCLKFQVGVRKNEPYIQRWKFEDCFAGTHRCKKCC